eukprot:109574_1
MIIYTDAVMWIPSMLIIVLLEIISNGYMLKQEFKHQKSGNSTFTTKYLKLWYFLCIISGFMNGIFALLQVINGFCYFSGYLWGITVFMQPIFMGYYQLSRIQYCFSKSKVYSDKGYSHCVFLIMYAISAIFVVNILIGLLLIGSCPIICGINKHYQFYYQPNFFNVPFNIRSSWLVASFLMYLLWDICILLLYSCKIRTFKRYKTENTNVYQRILSILHRILIITLFYWVMTSVVLIIYISVVMMIDSDAVRRWSGILFSLLGSLVNITYSYSISVMSEHNDKRYIKMLKLLQYSRLNYICCCYKNIVTNQLAQFMD